MNSLMEITVNRSLILDEFQHKMLIILLNFMTHRNYIITDYTELLHVDVGLNTGLYS